MPFRLRIALLALVTSGVVLVVFGVSFLAVIHRVGIERVDREIRAVAEGQFHGWHPVDHWVAFNQSLTFIYGDESSARPVVMVSDASGLVLFVSPGVPPEIAHMAVPDLAFAVAPGGPPGREGPPGGEAGFVARLDTNGDGKVSAAEFDGPPDQFPVFDADGDGFISEAEAGGLPPPRPPGGLPGGEPPRREPRQKVSVFRTVSTSHGDWRVGVLGNDLVTLVVGLDLADFSRDTAYFRNAFLVATPLALLLLGAAGWFLATRALRPVAEITRMAEGLTASDLDRRIPDESSDAEFRHLIQVLNGMLERLQTSFQQAERFSSDAAHELQTPLTVLQGELDVAIQSAAEGSEAQQTYVSLLDEVRRLKSVVHKLLLLARADAGRLPLNLKEIDLGALVLSAVEDARALAPDVPVEAQVEPDVRVMADADLLGQVLLNMATNAAKYTPAGGTIRFHLRGEGRLARLTLMNSGTPVPAAERERIFDRFHRLDESRSRSAGGSGLGLSLARELARAHHGDLVLDPAGSDGNAFTLTLPLA